MITKVTKSEFLDFFPEYTFVAGKLTKAGHRFAVFAGSEIWLLTESRIPTDLDLLVKDNELQAIADLFNKQIQTKSKAGVSADYFMIGNIEIVANISIIKDGKTVKINLDDTTIPKMISVSIDDITVPLLAPEDTLIIKSLLRRGREQEKFDVEDIENVMKKLPLDRNYIEKRARDLDVISHLDIILE